MTIPTQNRQTKPRIALITNHGYAGADIPVGGAPDTGGQNMYVNAKALALESIGMEVTIFTRGGFPVFNGKEVRAGEEHLSNNVRYVYVPGGGSEFIRKEDIAPSLKEEAVWMADFVSKEAAEHGEKPWDYFEVLDTHYWDAAIIANMVIERWHNQLAYEFLDYCLDGLFKPVLKEFKDDNKHKRSLARELYMHVGDMAQALYKGKTIHEIAEFIVPEPVVVNGLGFHAYTPHSYRGLEQTFHLGRRIMKNLRVDGMTIREKFDHTRRHIWTPHSTSIIKERNYWDKDWQTVRSLKFTERNDHEESVCMHTPLFCSTSPEVWTTLFSYHKQDIECIFDFPPCLNTNEFRPRSPDELEEVYTYLSRASGIDVPVLKRSRLIFESSRMDKTKRKDVLLKAFAPIATETDDTYLFIGGGPESSPVFEELNALKTSIPELDGRAFLLGFVPGDIINPLFSVPTLFVSASEMEGFGMSVSQAAAARIAIVSSDLIPFSTQFAADGTEIVPAGDIPGFTAAMRRLLDNPEKRRANADKLYEIAQTLNWISTSKNFIKWYRNYFGLSD